LSSIAFLTDIKSSRIDEFRAACDAKFELSTAFKPPAELAILKKLALVTDFAGSEAEKSEVLT
jgi:N-alpha-acetyltransferase 15/16, NatA auxiliary subunit